MVTVGSLFSGCGGTALGFQRAGFRHAWFVENNEYAAATLRKNFPGTIVYGNITTVDFRTVQPIDVLEGGFPCQDISKAGAGAGIKGSRSSLWKYYLEAIRVLRPRYVSIENVSALTSRGLDTVLIDLAAIRYDAEWHCISAASIGAPHRRDRIFILAYPSSKRQLDGESKNNSVEAGKSPQLALDTSCERYNTSNNDNSGLWQQGVLQRNSYGELTTKSGICGVRDGVPNRVDRIKCLGNAVVPQNAEVIAKAIMEKLYAENN